MDLEVQGGGGGKGTYWAHLPTHWKGTYWAHLPTRSEAKFIYSVAVLPATALPVSGNGPQELLPFSNTVSQGLPCSHQPCSSAHG